jgi:hypothetical protein
MQQNTVRNVITPIGVLPILLFLAACSTPTIPPQAPQSTETAQTHVTESVTATAVSPDGTISPAAEGSLCTNTHYPVRQGATWSYKSTGGPAGEYSFTDMISSARPDGFTLSTQIGEMTRTQEWVCTAEGLAALELGGAPAAALNSQGIQLNLAVSNLTGVTFPPEIQADDRWQQTMDVSGNVTALNEEAGATGSTQMNFHAVGVESVTVPAGTFDAIRLDVQVILNVDASYQGISVPVTFSGAYSYWFAPGVGWVKASGSGNIFGNSFSETTELQSYNVP